MNKQSTIHRLLAVSSTVALLATTMGVLNSPIFAQGYDFPILSPSFYTGDWPRSCDPSIQATIACRLEIEKNDRLSSRKFAEAVEAADLIEDLSQPNSDREIEFTVLVPANHALSDDIWNSLLEPANKEELVRFVKSHIIRGKIEEKDVTKGEIRAWGGNLIQIRDVSADSVSFSGANGEEIRVAAARIIHAGNGIIIFLDRVLVLPEL